MGSVTTDRYYSELPVWAGGNLYFNGAKPMRKETDAYVDSASPVTIGYEEKSGKVWLKTNVYELIKTKGKLMRTEDIAPAFEPEQAYENPDGSPIIFDTDFFGMKRGKNPIAGPFASAEEMKDNLF